MSVGRSCNGRTHGRPEDGQSVGRVTAAQTTPARAQSPGEGTRARIFASSTPHDAHNTGTHGENVYQNHDAGPTSSCRAAPHAPYAASTQHPAPARKHATPEPTQRTAGPTQHALHCTALHNRHNPTEQSKTEHTACCTQPQTPNRHLHQHRASRAVATREDHAMVTALAGYRQDLCELNWVREW